MELLYLLIYLFKECYHVKTYTAVMTVLMNKYLEIGWDISDIHV